LELTKEENKMTKKLKKELQAVNKELKAIAKKTKSLLKAVDKIDKPKAVKKAPAKKTGPKKAAPANAADKVLAIINRSKKGVDTETLMQKTGYERKKIFNLVYKLKKQGKVNSPSKGVYVKA
jgi:hypothetical protein